MFKFGMDSSVHFLGQFHCLTVIPPEGRFYLDRRNSLYIATLFLLYDKELGRCIMRTCSTAFFLTTSPLIEVLPLVILLEICIVILLVTFFLHT